MRKVILSLLIVLTWHVASSAQNLEQQIDDMLNARYVANEPGVTVLIAKNGDIIYHKAFGMANLELDVPMKTDMVFKIASVSKQFTAISILMLLEQGKLNLDDDITKYIEDYPTNGHHISIHHLLTHTSGITRSITQKPWNTNIRRSDFKTQEFIDYFKNEPMEFDPGEDYRYNNFGYFLLAAIIEKVSGMSYEDFIETNIFKPLEMENSYHFNNSNVIKGRAYGYEKQNSFIVKEYTSSTQAKGGGSLMSTVKDLYIWNRALKENKLIKPETLALAYENHKLHNGKKTNYGFGFFIDEINGSSTIEHAGGDHGFRTNAIYLPYEDTFVAAFSNCSCNDPRTISTKIAALVINKPYEAPQEVSLKEKDLFQWVGTYQFDDGSVRTTIVENGQLFSSRRGNKSKLSPVSKNKFMLGNNITSMSFHIKGDSIEAIFKNRIKETTAIFPSRNYQSVKLKKKDLNKFIGTFEIFPTFSIVITLEDGQLYAKGTNQDPLEVFPASNTKLFYKSIDADIEFQPSPEGDYNFFLITQSGAKYPAKRKE